MLKIEIMKDEEEVRKAYREFTKQEVLPEFLFGSYKEESVILGCLENGKLIGIAFGVAQKQSGYFFLHHISLDKEHIKKNILMWYLEAVYEWIGANCQVEKSIIEFRQPDTSEPFIVKYLSKLSSFQISEVVYMHQATLPTESFVKLREKHWYCPWLLEEKGYEAVPVQQCPKEEWEKIREAEERGDTEKDYLSPGFWETDMEYDEDTSFALVKKGERTPLGWIITQKRGEEAVLLRRFFIYKEERKKRLGPAFSTWVLDDIEKKFKYLSYEVVKGNRQMEMFLQCYCKPYLLENDCKCKIVLCKK